MHTQKCCLAQRKLEKKSFFHSTSNNHKSCIILRLYSVFGCARDDDAINDFHTHTNERHTGSCEKPLVCVPNASRYLRQVTQTLVNRAFDNANTLHGTAFEARAVVCVYQCLCSCAHCSVDQNKWWWGNK